MKHVLIAVWIWYTTAGGVLAFTDDKGFVPAAAEVHEIAVGPLACYARFTPTDPNSFCAAEPRLDLPR